MQSRARALRQYATIFPDAFTKYSDALSEGFAAGLKACRVLTAPKAASRTSLSWA